MKELLIILLVIGVIMWIGPGWVLAGVVIVICSITIGIRLSDNARPGIGGEYHKRGSEATIRRYYHGPAGGVEAAILADQRHNGRHLGSDVTVRVKRSLADKQSGEFETWNHAEWLEHNGPGVGVHIEYY